MRSIHGFTAATSMAGAGWAILPGDHCAGSRDIDQCSPWKSSFSSPAKAGRSPDEIQLIVPCFTAVGDTDEEKARWREMARMQVSFYGSTPNYAFIFEQLGHEGTTEKVREKQKLGDIAGMAAVIDDDLLSHFIVESDWNGAADAISSRYAGIAARVVLYFGAMDREHLDRWGEVARRLA
jgi:alkanesulfonate monooxygenase SsuD/methylene tetrahydromethanopterin reductase-like flavin-dependent oxidoreductase (luciferase family)